MNPRRRQRLYTVIAVLLGLGIASSLMMYALSSNIDLFYTPGEIIQGKGDDQIKPHIGQRLRVGGMVMPGSVQRDNNTLRVSFQLYDASNVITVVYNGILPDLFREGQSVVVQGILVQTNQLNASEVLAKHDENYRPPEVDEAMKKNHAGYSSLDSIRPGAPR